MIPPTLFCDVCGAANQPKAAFCRTCGSPLQSANPASRNTATGRLLTNHYSTNAIAFWMRWAKVIWDQAHNIFIV